MCGDVLRVPFSAWLGSKGTQRDNQNHFDTYPSENILHTNSGGGLILTPELTLSGHAQRPILALARFSSR